MISERRDILHIIDSLWLSARFQLPALSARVRVFENMTRRRREGDQMFEGPGRVPRIASRRPWADVTSRCWGFLLGSGHHCGVGLFQAGPLSFAARRPR